MSDDEDLKYVVGYKKPPAQHRYKKGQSGNRRGRPRGAKSAVGGHAMDDWWQKAWLDEGRRVVTATINGRRVRLPMGQLAVQRAFADAAAGKPTATRVVAQMMTHAERLRRERRDREMDEMIGFRRQARAELEQRLATGEVDPVVFPHPDDFVFNEETGEVDIVGPVNMQQHKAAMLLVRSCSQLIAALNNARFTRPDDVDRLRLVKELCETNSWLPPRLQQWPKPRFAQDYELFPNACVKKWAFDEEEGPLSSK